MVRITKLTMIGKQVPKLRTMVFFSGMNIVSISMMGLCLEI